jgi:hypothetical protein
VSRFANVTERFYDAVIENDDTRLCAGIRDSACRVVPGNFFVILLSLVLTRLGDLLASPKIVLAWLLGAVGAPAAAIGLLVPVREAGSLLPQMLLGAWIRGHPLRRGFWVAGSLLQALSVAAMAGAVWWLQAEAAGWAVVTLLALFALGRAVCSISMKDVQGKCVPKARRGRLSGLATSIAGIAVLGLGLALFGNDEAPSKQFYALLLLAAAATWLVAAGIFVRVEEHAGDTQGGHGLFESLARSANLLSDDVAFRRFVIARALLMCSAISAPFLVLLAQREAADTRLLGAFLLAASLATSVSAAFWGWMADTSARRAMLRAGAAAGLVCVATAAAGWMLEGWRWLGAAVVVAYFVLSVAHEGVRIGRKTYLVDMAEGDRRTDYVAVSNTVIGAALLCAGGLSGVIALHSTEAALMVLGLMGLAGVVAAARLEEV